MLSWQLWVIGGLFLGLLEVLSGNFVFLTIGLAALSTAIPAALFDSLPISLAWFGGANLLLLGFVRPQLTRRIMSRSRETNMNALVGRRIIVRLEEGHPSATLEGDIWRLETEEGKPLTEGEEVTVERISGNRLQVRHAK